MNTRHRFCAILALVATVTACKNNPGSDDPGTPPPPNVVIISADSLRPDRLKPFNPSATALTPHLNRLAQQGVVLENAWATAPWTAPSVVSIFTGLYPPSHGVVHRDDTTPSNLQTLAGLLAELDYELGNFSFFSGISYYRNLGFGEPDAALSHARPALAFKQWINPDRPFLAWIHLIEPHLPYGAAGYQATAVAVPGSSGLERSQLQCEVPIGTVDFDDGDREKILELYDADLETMDQALGKILRILRQNGVFDRTIVVFVADHGEELLEDGWVGHASTAIQAKFIPEILRIPMIITGPGVPKGVVISNMVQQVDILPTLAELIPIDLPYSTDGAAMNIDPSAREERRSFAFFDSSAGGNLTPAERRSERLQGITDGDCLLTQETTGLGTTEKLINLGDQDCTDEDEQILLENLTSWQASQAAGRLSILSRSALDQPPDLALVDEFAETIEVILPRPMARLNREATGGHIEIGWRGAQEDTWIEYAVGSGLTRVTGAFRAESNPMVFGPFPVGFWNDLSRHDPYRFRVCSPATKARSPWVQFHIEEAE